MIPFENSCEELNGDVLRVHIIANSDSAADQCLKLGVRDAVLKAVSPCYADVRNKSDAMELTEKNLPLIRRAAISAMRERGFDYDVSLSLENCYFNTRRYDDFTMPAGCYDALRLTIGEGEGQNFWCVLFPTLCVGAACEDAMEENLSDAEMKVLRSGDVELRFKVVEYYQKMRDWLHH